MAKGEGWAKVQGFFDGLVGVTNSVGSIVDTGANMAEDIARGKSAIATEQFEKREREQNLFLDMLKTERGDNIQLYWAAAFVAVLGVVLIARG